MAPLCGALWNWRRMRIFGTIRAFRPQCGEAQTNMPQASTDTRFPVESVIPQIERSLAANRSVVLRAPPGSGKTTCVAPALLDTPFLRGKKIVMLEPRRLAARSCAQFIAGRLGCRVGGTVGYQVRLERKIGPDTRLEILTEGLLTRRLLSDPELSDVGLLIFDEFHERSLQCDTAFAMALDVRHALRDDLRIMVMSATLDTALISDHLGDADIHTAEARMFPIETHYMMDEPAGPISSTMAGAVNRALRETEGDVLCFLPGEGEIKRCMESLRTEPRPGVDVLPLYGALPKEEQDRAVTPHAGDGKRRVILATSIAETSLTIPGVRVVIDSGLARIPRFSPSSGMSRLETVRLSRDRAEQRRGRAGRVAAGVCYRLWTESSDRLLAERMSPEILDADLADTVLTCANWGSSAPDAVPWLTPPPAATWERSAKLLQYLDALDKDGRVTSHGRRMSELAIHPRLANMILRGGAPEKSATLAAIIEEGAPHSITDIREVRPSPRARELAKRWARMGGTERGGFAPEAGELLALAYPDRIARNRGNGTFQMVSGRGAFLERTESLAHSDFVVCCELNDGGGDAKIHLAAPIGEDAIEDIFGHLCEDVETVEWDKRTDAVRAAKRRMLGRLVLRETASHEPDQNLVQQALFDGIRAKGVANLPGWDKDTRQLQARICFLNRVLGGDTANGGWPDVSDAALEAKLAEWFAGFTLGMSRWSHLAKLNLRSVLEFAVSDSGRSMRELDRLAPVKMEVPSGSMMTIHYEEDEPFVQVRIQETFGLAETPKVAGGKIPILMKLLSPAQRPVQITKDLASFWKEGYALVRKDLRGRYPKHYWPEDPTTAIATRRVRPPNPKQ